MRMTTGEIWRCTNRECGCAVQVIIGARTERASNPTCACGATLKKPYVKPSIKIADVKESEQLKKTYATVPN